MSSTLTIRQQRQYYTYSEKNSEKTFSKLMQLTCVNIANFW